MKQEVNLISKEEVNVVVKDIGKKIKERREELKITQLDFSLECGVNTATLSAIEHGRGISLVSLIRILDFLGLELEIN